MTDFKHVGLFNIVIVTEGQKEKIKGSVYTVIIIVWYLKVNYFFVIFMSFIFSHKIFYWMIMENMAESSLNNFKNIYLKMVINVSIKLFIIDISGGSKIMESPVSISLDFLVSKINQCCINGEWCWLMATDPEKAVHNDCNCNIIVDIRFLILNLITILLRIDFSMMWRNRFLR